MKVQYVVTFIIVCVIVGIGLIAYPFLPRIQAALTTSTKHAPPKAQHAPAKSPTTIAVKQPTAPTPKLLAQDSFQRGNHLFWGMASNGQTWGADANNNPNFSIVNHTGRIANQNGIYNATLGPATQDSEVLFSGSLSSLAQQSNLGAVVRWRDANNWYKAYVNATSFVLLRGVAGAQTRLVAIPYQTQPNVAYSIRFRAVGPQLMAKVWPTAQAEPKAWMLQATDNALTLGFDGLRLVLGQGVQATITSFSESTVTATKPGA